MSALLAAVLGLAWGVPLGEFLRQRITRRTL